MGEESGIVGPEEARMPMRKSHFAEEQIAHALRQWRLERKSPQWVERWK
jgi:hypothetical protein